jgi:hypothetical protein
MYTTLHVSVIIRPSSGGTYLIKLNLHMLQRNIFYLLTFNLHCILTYTCIKLRSRIKLILKLCWMYEIKIEDKINIKIKITKYNIQHNFNIYLRS